MNKENNCYNCGYCRNAVGSAHKECSFRWLGSGLKSPDADPYGVKMGWYHFPINFDPTWQKSPCQAWSGTADPEKTTKHPFLNFIAFMVGEI